MGPTIFILAIMGCGEADAPCEQVAVLPARYASVDACNSQSEAAIERYQNIDYPVVVAQCRRTGVAVAEQLKAGDVKLPGPARVRRIDRAVYKPGQRVRT